MVAWNARVVEFKKKKKIPNVRSLLPRRSEERYRKPNLSGYQLEVSAPLLYRNSPCDHVLQ